MRPSDWTFLAILLGIIYGVLAIPYIIYGTGPLFRTELVSIINRNCYESDEHIIAEQFITITGNITALFDCGRVISCLDSPCYMPFNNPGDGVYIVGWTGNYYRAANSFSYSVSIVIHIVMTLLLSAVIICTVVYMTLNCGCCCGSKKYVAVDIENLDIQDSIDRDNGKND